MVGELIVRFESEKEDSELAEILGGWEKEGTDLIFIITGPYGRYIGMRNSNKYVNDLKILKTGPITIDENGQEIYITPDIIYICCSNHKHHSFYQEPIFAKYGEKVEVRPNPTKEDLCDDIRKIIDEEKLEYIAQTQGFSVYVRVENALEAYERLKKYKTKDIVVMTSQIYTKGLC